MSYKFGKRSLATFSDTISFFEVTTARTAAPYDNFADSEIEKLEHSYLTNATICSFINSQGSWKLLYNDICHTTVKHYACNSISSLNLWKVTSGSGIPNNGMSACNSEFGSDFAYGTPSDAHSNSLLSVLCALDYIDLVHCSVHYYQYGLTLQFNGVCKYPTNYRVKRGLYNDDELGACASARVVQEALTGAEIVEQLFKNRKTHDQLQRAWTGSFIGRNLFQKRGGWIHSNPNNPRQFQVVLAPRSASRSFCACR